ncbi:hypothetical protein C5167_013073 [Papaver somniferum]|uniref:Uncharacterized protein n=1 Tax=Papaver somniferum TaxID=3469 RepID=A0A4Y7J2N9_PAPSO|nr:hypothetical protein C5167_013073 [Papaver somniferum]
MKFQDDEIDGRICQSTQTPLLFVI